MKKVIPGVNDLKTKNPNIAKQWHPTKNGFLTAEQVTAYCNDKAWWQCEKGHEWEAIIGSRHKGAGCPVCAGRKAWTGYNDMATTHPHLAAEFHPRKNGDRTPQNTIAGVARKLWWQCANGHEWEATGNSRIAGNGCPYCSGYRPIPGKTDLATTNPDVAAQWHPTKNGKLTPCDVKRNTEKVVWWLGPCGHEWDARIRDRTDEEQPCGCPYCAEERNASFPETIVFFYISKAFPDAVTPALFAWLGRKRLDMYIPSLRVAIEYDGHAWHKSDDCVRRDKEKLILCHNNNVRLIRIREPGLPEIEGECIKLRSQSMKSLNSAICELLSKYLPQGDKVDVNVLRDKDTIKQIYQQKNGRYEA